MVALSASSIKVSWLEPRPANGLITGYRLTYVDESFPIIGLVSSPIYFNGSVHSVVIDGLKPYRKYSVVVQAKTEEPPGHSLWGVVSTHTYVVTMSASE